VNTSTRKSLKYPKKTEAGKKTDSLCTSSGETLKEDENINEVAQESESKTVRFINLIFTIPLIFV
jgi:hypothetical protein